MRIFLYILNVLISLVYNTYLHNNLKDPETIKYLEYPFKRNITSNEITKPEEFFKTYFYNQLYINLLVGSNKLEIPFYLHLQQYPLVIQSSNVEDSQVKGLYNELNSENYESLEKTASEFTLGDLRTGILSKDYFYYNNNKKSYLNFYLAKQNIEDSHITEGGKIGFKIKPTYAESEKSSFILNLKNENIISSYIFTFKYDSDKIEDDSGKFYIGEFPHIYNPKQYKEEYFIKYSGERDIDGVEWIYYFDEIKVGNDVVDSKRNIYFYLELGYIIAMKNFFEYLNKVPIWNEYFNINKKCHQEKFKIKDFETNDYYQRYSFNLTGYYCDKDVDVEKFNIENISFLKRQMNYAFNFSFNELWMEKDDYKFFMIIQAGDFEDTWIFGKPFFKKYQMVFDSDNKYIGLYTKIFEDNSTKNDSDSNNDNGGEDNKKIKKFNITYIIIIVALVVIIIGLTVLLIKYIINYPRKTRANELKDDNYEYTEDMINNN